MNRNERRLRYLKHIATNRTRELRHRMTSADQPRWKRAVRRAAIVSFDVFDTALFRCVCEPADVFEIVGYRLRERQRITADPAAFRLARIAAESAARQRVADQGGEEVTLAEIYDQFAALYPALAVSGAAEEELAVERAVLVANPAVKRAYDAAVAAGKRIAFVSDTYFPEAFVAERLRAAGYDHEHMLFASSTHGATKERGSLFDIVVAAVAPARDRRIVHLGDNRNVDVVMARWHGLDAFWYRSTESRDVRFADDRSLVERVTSRLESLAASQVGGSREDRMFATLGVGTMGPIFLGFTQWLAERLQERPTDLLLFCSRDGYLIEQLFELFQIRDGYHESRYFEVSRRSLNVPSIDVIDARALEILCGNNAELPLPQFFSRIGIDIAPYDDVVQACGLRLDHVIATLDDRARLGTVFERLSEVVLAALRRERPLLLAYLRASGCLDAREISLVDIGWGASLQTSLALVLERTGRRVPVRGYYVSTDVRVERLGPDTGDIESWLCRAGQPLWMQRTMSQGYWMLEIAFAAPHGSVLGYETVAGTPKAVRQAYDRAEPAARAGQELKRHAYEFAARWRAIFDGIGPTIEREQAFRRFERAVNAPPRVQAAFFGDILHHGGLGESRERQYIARPPSPTEFLRHPLTLRREYFRSHWKRGYLTRVLDSSSRASVFMDLTQRIRALRAMLTRYLHRS